MAKRKFSAAQIGMKLRQVRVSMGDGKSVQQACKEAGITDFTYYRWRRKYRGLKSDQAKRFKELEKEIRKDVAEGNF
jgi:putative transposase